MAVTHVDVWRPDTSMETWGGVDPGRAAAAERLRRLGLSRMQARAYLTLLAGPRSVREVAGELGIEAEDAEDLLAKLREKGLVRPVRGRRESFAMVPPHWVLPSLVLNREAETAELRALIEEIGRRYATGGEGWKPEEYVEIIAGAEGVLARTRGVLGMARREALSCSKVPPLDPSPITETVRRGIAVKSLLDSGLLAQPGMMERARARAEAGEDIRVCADVPSNLVIVDGEAGLVQFAAGEEEPVVALLTRNPDLVGLLLLLFRLLWDRATRMFGGTPEGNRERDRLIDCLSSGMTDSAIMRTLGISRRTLTRRLRDLLHDLGVENRFQAGLKVAAMRGWTDGEDVDPRP